MTKMVAHRVNVHLKMIRMVNFILCVFYYYKKEMLKMFEKSITSTLWL